MAKPGHRNQNAVRKDRPDDLHTVIREVHDAWLVSDMPITEIAELVKTRPGNLYAWFGGNGRPDIRVLDDLLGVIGWKFSIIDDRRAETAELRKQAGWEPEANNANAADPSPDAHPIIRDWFNAWKQSKLNFSSLAAISGFSASTLYRWRDNEGVPTVAGIETALNVIGKRLKVVRGTRPIIVNGRPR